MKAPRSGQCGLALAHRLERGSFPRLSSTSPRRSMCPVHWSPGLTKMETVSVPLPLGPTASPFRRSIRKSREHHVKRCFAAGLCTSPRTCSGAIPESPCSPIGEPRATAGSRSTTPPAPLLGTSLSSMTSPCPKNHTGFLSCRCLPHVRAQNSNGCLARSYTAPVSACFVNSSRERHPRPESSSSVLSWRTWRRHSMCVTRLFRSLPAKRPASARWLSGRPAGS